MKRYEFIWEISQQVKATIEAESKQEALEKWKNGEFSKREVKEEQLLSSYVDVNGDNHDVNTLEKAKFG